MTVRWASLTTRTKCTGRSFDEREPRGEATSDRQVDRSLEFRFRPCAVLGDQSGTHGLRWTPRVHATKAPISSNRRSLRESRSSVKNRSTCTSPESIVERRPFAAPQSRSRLASYVVLILATDPFTTRSKPVSSAICTKFPSLRAIPGLGPEAYSDGLRRNSARHDDPRFRHNAVILGEKPEVVTATGARLVAPALMEKRGDYDTVTVAMTTASGKQAVITNSREAV
jgi:hypothetical protein